MQFFAEPLECARQTCPKLSLFDAMKTTEGPCLSSCSSIKAPEFVDENGTPVVTEAEILRCSKAFKNQDQQEMFRIAFCMTASQATSILIEPFTECTRKDACANQEVFRSPGCLEQCEDEALQLVEVTTTAMERCAGLPQTKTTLCKILERTINICFVPKHCDRLLELLKTSCPELTVRKSS
ncbi:MAG: hypothetical protein K1X83_15250 [Oligoflexia bacterium]|nr:hypothetical protein [Oligoflexia bacterium]